MRRSVSIFGPNAFSMRRAISGESAARRFQEGRQRGAGDAEHLGPDGDGEPQGLDDLHPDERPQVRGLRHAAHGAGSQW